MIETHEHGDVLEVVMAKPPVNALGAAMRQGLAKVIAEAQERDGLRGIVIRGSGRLFSAGADITEFDAVPVEPQLFGVIDAIEASSVPVVAAIHGMALGGGLEVALGCHYRIATPSAKFALPEVKLGLLPAAGGTQRLPRLVGSEAALGLIVLGETISAQMATEIGLIDKIVDEDQLAAEAIRYARSVGHVRRTGDREVVNAPNLFDRFTSSHDRFIKGLDAPQACIEAVKAAATMPLAEAQKEERALFTSLVAGDQSKALRHIFFAERAAAKIEGLPKDIGLRSIGRVGVIGAGTMGGGISMNFLSAGIPVTIVDVAQGALDRGIGVVRANYEATAAKGRMTAAQVDKAMNLLTPSLEFGVLKDCDLIIEAVYEDMDVKKEIFARLDTIAKPGAILASNTSLLNIDTIASATSRPADVLGLHFFSPANVMKLVEVVRGAETAPDVLATGMDLARRIKKTPVVAGVCYGFIGNRMLIPRQEQATALLLEGATPQQIDRVHTAFGMPMGPFQMIDLAGVDIGWRRDPQRVESLQDALCVQGRWGQKTGAGFYDYDNNRKPTPSPVVEQIISDFRTMAGATPRAISDEEITARTLYTMINEGAKILEEGIAQRASDIDVVWVFGYGWPRHMGGPMFWADQIGLHTIVDAINRYRDRLGDTFSLSPRLEERAAAGGRLGA